MITFSIIKKSQLEGANRIDAECYQPEYLRLRENIKNMGFLNFSEIIKSFCSGKNLKQIESNKFPKFIRTQNVRPIIISSDGMSHCAMEKYPKLNYGDLLFVRVGEGVGNSSVVTKSFQSSTFSDNVIKISIKNINPFYVSVLLNSRIGYLLMESVKKGSARSLISRENLESINIPKISEKEQIYFEEIINKVEKEIIDSEYLYQQAENLLLENLGLSGFDFDKDLSAEINFLEVLEAERIDAEYFQKKYKIITEKIKKYNASKLGDLVSVKKGIEVGAEEYQEPSDAEALAGKRRKIFIRVSSMTKFGIVESDQKYLSEKLYEKLKKDFEPKIGEILLTKDATPGIAYVLKNDIQGIISGGTLRLKLKDGEVEGEYLALCLNSLIGQMQAERDAGGSVIAHWKPEQIKNVLIPILPKETQVKISELVRKSFESKKIAKELLEEAKRKIEEEIEKG